MIISTDIAIAGGGIAGISAAIAAAEEKKKVILIDRLPTIGGASVNSNVGTVCGAFYRSNSKQKVAGNSFSKFFVDALDRTPGISKPYHHQDGLYIIPYEWIALRNLYEQLLNEYSIEVKLNTLIKQVNIQGNRITELVIQDEQIIKSNSVIDCSGNALISQLADLESIKDKSYQPASQIFRLRNISDINEYTLNMALKKVILKYESEFNWPKSHRALSVVQGSIRNNTFDLKLIIPDVITDQTNLESLSSKGIESIHNLFPVLKREIKSLEEAEIETIFPLPGYRVMQRSRGKYILTEEDVMTCKKSHQGIAVGTWPIEEWDYDGKLNMQFFAEDDGYHIPAHCLVSDQLENLFFGGRNISAASKAIASARVMGTCWQTGYAAGKLSCAHDQNEFQKTIDILNRELQ